MHLGHGLALIALLSAGQVSPAGDTTFETKGNKDVVFRAQTHGMYRVRVVSEAGTACSIADHLRGPFASDGKVGTESCDMDLLLEAGLYKARLSSPEKGKGKGRLDVAAFADVSPGVRLDEGKTLTLNIKPREQVSTWMRIEKRQSVTLELAGRTIGKVALWRDGRWLEEVNLRRTDASPRPGKNIHRWRMDEILEPGEYKVVAYGAEPKSWTKGPEEDVAFITRGAPPGGPARSRAFTIPAWGFTQLAVEQGDVAAFLELDRIPTDSVSMRLEMLRRDEALAGAVRSLSANASCTVHSNMGIPSCTTMSRGGVSHVITIEGAPGTAGTITWGPLGNINTEGFWGAGSVRDLRIGAAGTYFVSAPALPASMDAEPLGCAIDEINAKGDFVRRVAIDAPTVSWTQPFERSFNYTATSTAIWVQIEKPGLYDISGDDKVKASCEIYRIDNWKRSREGAGEDGKCNSKRALSPGVYEIRFYGGRSGIQTLKIAQMGLGGIKATTPAKSSCTFENLALTQGTYRLATSSDGGAQLRAFLARATPSSLSASLPLVIDPTRPVSVPVAAGAAVVARARPGLKLRCKLNGADVATAAGACQTSALSASGTLTLSNEETAPISVIVSRVEPPQSLESLPRFDPAALKLPTLTASVPLWFDFDRNQQRSMVVTVDKPGLYDLTSEGLLATHCRLRTPTIGNLAEGAANGRGRNCLVQAYLKPGTYLFTAQAQGQSKGRAGLRLVQRPPRDMGTIPIGEDLFFRVGAGELAQQTLDVRKGTRVDISTTAQGGNLSCRIEDHDGWPLTTVPTSCAQNMELEPGRYLLTALPLTVDSRRRTSMTKQVEEVVLQGDKTAHTLALNRSYPAQLGTDGKDQFTFTLAAEMQVGIELDRGMQGRVMNAKKEVVDVVEPVGGGGFALSSGGGGDDEGEYEGDGGGGDGAYVEGDGSEGEYAEGDGDGGYDDGGGGGDGSEEYGEYDGEDEYSRRQRELREEQRRASAAAEMAAATAPKELGALRGKVMRLAAGTYTLETEHSRGDVAIRYNVKIGVRELAPNVVLTAPVPGKIEVAMPGASEARAGLLRIKTKGDVDVRCRLRDEHGQLVAESAESGADWNCALAVPLGAGRYTLNLEAETLTPGTTELSAAFLEAKDTGELKDGGTFKVVAKVASAPLPAGDADDVHDVWMTSEQDFSCAVQDGNGTMLDRRVSVRQCRFLLWPGEASQKMQFRVFAWTPDRPASVKVSLKKRDVKGFGGGGLDDDEVGRKKIDTRGRYLTGKGALCRAVSAGGGALKPCDGAASFAAGDVLIALPGDGRAELDEQVAQLAPAPSTEPRKLDASRAAQRQRSKGGKAVHLVQVQAPFGSSSAPSCMIEGGVAAHDASTCASATGPVEESTLVAWTRAAANLDATLVRRAVPWPSSTSALPVGRASLAWPGGDIATARWSLPNDGFRLVLALPADAWAVFIDGEGRARDLCAPRRAPVADKPSAMSTCILRGRGGELFIASGPSGKSDARSDLLVLSTAEAPRALVGLRESKPAAPGRERLLIAAAPAPRALRIEGYGVLACAIHLDDGTHVAGCRATLPAGQGAEIKVEHDDRSWRVFAYAPGQIAAGRYGALPSGAGSDGSAIPMGTAAALAGNVVIKRVELKAPASVRVRATSGVCALVVDGRIVESEGLGGGCDIVRVLPAGSHRVVVRGFGTSGLSGNVNVSSEPVLALDEGINAEGVVQGGDARTWRFVLAGDGEVGVGLQADADALHCTLLTEAQDVVGDGCHQFHRNLKKGTYYLRVAAPDDGPPRRFKPVVFGLKGSVVDVPEAWLRDFFARTATVGRNP